MKKTRYLWLLGTCLPIISACTGSASSEKKTTVAQYTETNSVNNLRDPSLKKCLTDGYKLKALDKAGVVQSYQCINTKTDKYCDSWAYFRGECKLTVKNIND